MCVYSCCRMPTDLPFQKFLFWILTRKNDIKKVPSGRKDFKKYCFRSFTRNPVAGANFL